MRKTLLMMNALLVLIAGCGGVMDKFPLYPIENLDVEPIISNEELSVVVDPTGERGKGKATYKNDWAKEKKTYAIDFDKVNHAAIEIIRGGIEINNVPLSDQAKKVITFATVGARWGDWPVKIIYLDCVCATGDGYKKEFTAEGGAVTHWSDALGDAIRNAAIETLKDPAVRAYIQGETRQPGA